MVGVSGRYMVERSFVQFVVLRTVDGTVFEVFNAVISFFALHLDSLSIDVGPAISFPQNVLVIVNFVLQVLFDVAHSIGASSRHRCYTLRHEVVFF